MRFAASSSGTKKPPSAASAPSSLAQLAIRSCAPESPEKQKFTANYAPSDRSTCRHCGLGIAMNSLRIGTYVSSGSGDFQLLLYSHPECFANGFRHSHPDALNGIIDGVESWSEVSADDALRVVKIAGGPSATIPAAELHQLKQQNDLLAAASDALREKKPAQLAAAVDDVFGGIGCEITEVKGVKKEHAVAALADAMVFGAAAPCAACKGLMVPRAHAYRCTGHADEFTKCTEVAETVKRHKYKHPKALLGDLPQALQKSGNSGAPIKSDRLLRPTVTGMRPGCVARPRLFEGMTFAISSKVKKGDELAVMIKALGGTVVKKVAKDAAPHTTRIVATAASDAKECGGSGGGTLVPVVLRDWVDKCVENDSTMFVPELHQCFLENGPSSSVKDELAKRLQKLSEGDNKSASPSAAPKSVVVSGGVAVDPAVEDAHLYAVHCDASSGKPFHASMAKADLGRDQNSFYVMQILQRKSGLNPFCLFRRWGRVGDDTKSGMVMKEFPTADKAVREFEKVFFDKSGNLWGTAFTKQPGSFNLIETDYTAKEVIDVGKNGSAKSKKGGNREGAASSVAAETLRDKATRELIARMFNNTSMEKSLETMQIDLTKLPLGNLKGETLQKGKQILVDIQRVLRESVAPAGKGKSKTVDHKALERQLTSLSNRFYSTIPQQFPANVATSELLLDTPTKLAAKFDLLSDLGDIVATQKIMRDSASEADPLVACFQSLKISLSPLPQSDAAYAVLSKYFKESQGRTHRNCKLHRIWVLERAGETERFAPWAADKNRKLLWHGSRFTNWVGILSQGLRIAPPEAPVTGYMFGRGIYAADAVSKSANYCHLNSETGLMTLGEFALGKPTERYHSDSSLSFDTLPKGTHSTFAIGCTGPRDEIVWNEGIRVPTKFSESSKYSGSLSYNEYIIYDVAQCRLRYLLEVSMD